MPKTTPYFSWQQLDDIAERLLQHKPERKKELVSIGSQLSQLSKNDVERSDRYYPIRFFSDGVAAYYEAFNNAAVFYSGLAVELAIDLRIWQHLDNDGQWPPVGKPRRPSAAAKIGEAVELGILPDGFRARAHQLRKMRNSYIHYRNILEFEVDTSERALTKIQSIHPAVVEELQRKITDQELLKVALKDLATMMESASENVHDERGLMSLLDANQNSEAHDFLKSRRESYLQWVDDADTIPEHVLRLGYGAERRDALDSVFWAAEILEALSFLP